MSVATNQNRTTSQGASPSSFSGKTSLTLTNVVTSGGTLQLPISGNVFYLISSTGQIEIRPTGAGYTGVFNKYVGGTGLRVPTVNSFNLLEVRNTTENDVVFQLFVGFDEFIDKRLVFTSAENPVVAYPTYQVPSTLEEVDIPDKSGTQFLDINGNKWFAVSRVAILIFNASEANVFLQKADAAATPPSGTAIAPVDGGVAIVFPSTGIRYDASGDYRVRGATGVEFNGIVSELYNAIFNPN